MYSKLPITHWELLFSGASPAPFIRAYTVFTVSKTHDDYHSFETGVLYIHTGNSYPLYS